MSTACNNRILLGELDETSPLPNNQLAGVKKASIWEWLTGRAVKVTVQDSNNASHYTWVNVASFNKYLDRNSNILKPLSFFDHFVMRPNYKTTYSDIFNKIQKKAAYKTAQQSSEAFNQTIDKASITKSLNNLGVLSKDSTMFKSVKSLEGKGKHVLKNMASSFLSGWAELTSAANVAEHEWNSEWNEMQDNLPCAVIVL